MSERRPTCLIKHPSETHWRPICVIRDHHAWSRMPISNQTSWSPKGFQWVSDRSLIDTVMPERRQTCLILDPLEMSNRSLMRRVGLRWGMSVSDESHWSSMRHFTLHCVSNQTFWSPMGHRRVMLVSDQTCWSPMGLR